MAAESVSFPDEHSKGEQAPFRMSRPAPRSATRLSEDRYRLGGRRTSAEPLRASWQPEKGEPEEGAEGSGGKRPAKDGLVARLAGAYGWRMYVLPILLVITALVVFDTATGPAQQVTEQTASSDGTSDGSAVVSENPAEQVDLNIPTAVLPEGGKYTEAGTGEWHTVPGSGDRVGTGGKLYTYTVDVEDGIDPGSYAGDDSFASAVQGILSDPRSWTGDGKVSFQRVDPSYPNPTFRVSLTTPNTAHRADVCGFQIRYESSCYRKSLGRVVINLARWVRGAKAFSGDMTGYRQYAINHEVGHAVGNKHVGCPENGVLAPVMMQQTFGVSNDYVAKLNEVDPSNYGAVPADGKVCRPSAWPNPQAGQ